MRGQRSDAPSVRHLQWNPWASVAPDAVICRATYSSPWCDAFNSHVEWTVQLPSVSDPLLQ